MTGSENSDGNGVGSAGRFTLDVSLSVLDDLGTNLYSSIPAVLSEAVANAWDADATEVRIGIGKNAITVSDNGVGMTVEDMQNKYLTIGYRRRASGAETSPKGRPVMGRKGIGKLSLFAIARTIEVTTRHEDAPPVSIRMREPDIKRAIEQGVDYHPEDIQPPESSERGTTIEVSDLRVIPNTMTPGWLRKRIARRFSVIGRDDFRIWVQDSEVTFDDRNDLPNLEYLWIAGDPRPDPRDLAAAAKKSFELPPLAAGGKESAVRGWLGTFSEQKEVHAEEGDNQVAVLARGKVVHEDLLPSVKAAGYAARYLIGRLDADYLDEDDKDDIATSDRQSVKETDERFESLLDWFQKAMRQVANDWNRERSKNSLQSAMDEFQAIKEWHGGLSKDAKNFAEKLFGKIGSLYKSDPEARCELYRTSIVAFERLRLREIMTSIDDLPEDADLSLLTAFFRNIDEIEEVEYHQISEGRLRALQEFQRIVDEDRREHIIRDYLFDHLWLLDPAWDRATGSEFMEKRIKKALGIETDQLSEEEERGRIDIGYRTHAGKHIVVELKRASARPKFSELHDQLAKYWDTVVKVLRANGASDPDVEVVAVLGSDPSGYPADPVRRAGALREAANARVITYDTLLQNAENAYAEYMEANKRASRLTDLLDRIRPA